MNIVIKKFEELSIDELYELLKIRVNVFVVEQKCPYPEVDDRDKHAYHVYIQEGGEVKAYLRVLEAGVSFDEFLEDGIPHVQMILNMSKNEK